MDSERVRSMLPTVYILCEEALPSNLKGTIITVNVQRLIKKAGSSSGLKLLLREIINHRNWYLLR